MHVLCSRACLLRLRTMQTFLRKQFRTKDKHCLTHKTCKKSTERCLLTSLIYMKFTLLSFPGDSVVKNPQCRRHEFIPWLGKIHWRRKWQLTSVFLPGKSHGSRSLVGYSPWGCKSRIRLSDSNNNRSYRYIGYTYVCLYIYLVIAM